DVIGISPKSFEDWGLCPTCSIELSKGTTAWMNKFVPRGFVPYAWRNPPRVLVGGPKRRRKGAGRIKADLEAVSLPPGSEIAKEFSGIKFLNQYDKARYFERLAEEQGVLHLLKCTQESANHSSIPETVGLSRVKSYASSLDLSQRKLGKLALQENFVLRGDYVVAKDILKFVCCHFDLPLSPPSSSRGTPATVQHLVVRIDFGGGTNKVVVRPYGKAGGHGCLVLLDGRKDSRNITEELINELRPLEENFHLLYSCDTKQMQFPAGTSSNACWLCCTVEKKNRGRNVFAVDPAEDRWDKAADYVKEYEEKRVRMKRPPAHVNGQKFLPRVPRDSLLLPWLHILMGITRNVFDEMLRSGVCRYQLESLLSEMLHVNPTKPIVGSTLSKTNILSYNGKDCRIILEKVDEIEQSLAAFEKGEDACKVFRSARSVMRSLLALNSVEKLREEIDRFKNTYLSGGFNPSLVIHLLVAHGVELYLPHSTQGLGLLTEELSERIHSAVNTVVRRSQLKSDLMKQIALWNWQYSLNDVSEAAGNLTPPCSKRKRKAVVRSPQVDLSSASQCLSGKTGSEYVDTSDIRQ
ncbi:hypothetical protein FOL47_010093, partial [Perkinsus chesapeaki]